MILSLPPRLGGRQDALDTADSRNIIIIGANGAGKTRFANRLAADMGTSAVHLSALNALYAKDKENLSEGSIDSLYRRATEQEGLLRADIRGEFERMVALMVNEEMLTLINNKFAAPAGNRRVTRLEHVMKAWQSLFPGNRPRVESGRMLFDRGASDPYSPSKLSDGEKAALYYLGAATYLPHGATVIVDSPGTFLHPSIIGRVWDMVEQSRRDCLFVYVTHDLQFASSRRQGPIVWVKGCDNERSEWDYEFLDSAEGISDEVYLAILGDRRPVLFIEGDGKNSIDARLYPLIFNEYTVKSLGGCDRVIESTRTFNSLKSFHNLNAFGIVDRDRRDEGEVGYLRNKQILVPEVAEIENIFMLEDVLRTLATVNGRDPDEAFGKVKHTILRLFQADLHSQALQHTRHRVKRAVEHRIDGRFANISQLEEHLLELPAQINPRGLYERLCNDFNRYLREEDYASILRVYNRKTMLSESHAARHVGLRKDSEDSLIRAVLALLRRDTPEAKTVRQAIRREFK